MKREKGRGLRAAVCCIGLGPLVAGIGCIGAIAAVTGCEAPTATLSVQDGHSCELGQGMSLWAFDLKGEDVPCMRLELTLIANGEARRMSNATFANLPPDFKCQVYVLMLTGSVFEKRTDIAFTMSASFVPVQHADTWERQWFKVPAEMVLTYTRGTWSGRAGPGQQISLLTMILSPQRKLVDPVLRQHWPVEEWKKITKNRNEIVIAATVILEE